MIVIDSWSSYSLHSLPRTWNGTQTIFIWVWERIEKVASLSMLRKLCTLLNLTASFFFCVRHSWKFTETRIASECVDIREGLLRNATVGTVQAKRLYSLAKCWIRQFSYMSWWRRVLGKQENTQNYVLQVYEEDHGTSRIAEATHSNKRPTQADVEKHLRYWNRNEGNNVGVGIKPHSELGGIMNHLMLCVTRYVYVRSRLSKRKITCFTHIQASNAKIISRKIQDYIIYSAAQFPSFSPSVYIWA